MEHAPGYSDSGSHSENTADSLESAVAIYLQAISETDSLYSEAESMYKSGNIREAMDLYGIAAHNFTLIAENTPYAAEKSVNYESAGFVLLRMAIHKDGEERRRFIEEAHDCYSKAAACDITNLSAERNLRRIRIIMEEEGIGMTSN